MENDIYQLLLKSMDTELSVNDNIILEQALARSVKLQEEQEQLIRLRNTLKKQNYEFKPFFTGRVMNSINNSQNQANTFTDNIFFIFKRIALSGIAAIIILLLTVYISDESLDFYTMSGIGIVLDEDITNTILYDDQLSMISY